MRAPIHFLCAGLLAFAASMHVPARANPQAAVNYDVVCVRQPRRGDNQHVVWPEVFHPARIEPGSDLMLLHPDGSEEVLVAAGNGAVTDPYVSFDGQSVYYSFFPDVRADRLNGQRGNLPYAGADIYRIHLGTRQVQRLTQSVPGNADTLPPGAKINDADLDYTGTIMPPPNSGAPH